MTSRRVREEQCTDDVGLAVPIDRQEFVETPRGRIRAGRGVLAGIMIGTAIWIVILMLVGVIKL